MTASQLLVARTEIEGFESEGRSELATELFTSDYRLHFPGFPPIDANGHAQVLSMFRAAFPDLRVRVVAQVMEGDRVANHIEMTGTHRGAFQGIPATNKRICVTGNNLMRFADGRIAELWGQLDMLGLLQQIGAAPEGPPRPQLPASRPGVTARPDAAKALVRTFVARFNAKDPAGCAAPYGESYDLDFPGGPTGHGVAGIREATEAFMGAFPDLHFSIDDLISDGASVVWRWTMTGTHRGALGPFPASDKAVRLEGISLFAVRDGQIVEDRVRADMVGLLQQIGAIPAAGSA